MDMSDERVMVVNRLWPRLFLSYARDDDERFVRRLCDDLRAAGFTVWYDRDSIASRQLTFHQEIKDAIRTSVDRLIYVAGPSAVMSESVREEWRFALQLDRPVIPILRLGGRDAIPDELRLIHFEDFRDDARYSERLASLVSNLLRPEPPMGVLFGVPSLPAHFVERPELLQRLRESLLADLHGSLIITASERGVGVQGMGGIGKSVIAAALARDRQVRRSYPDGIIWLSIGQQPGLAQLQRDLARFLGCREHFVTQVHGTEVLRGLLTSKAVLLILDDLWEATDAKAFDVLGPRCRLLITTRDAGILHTLGGEVIPVSLFAENEAVQLLAQAAGVEGSALPPEAPEIIAECDGLPLALALTGGMAARHRGGWAEIVLRLRQAKLETIADRNAINPRHRSVWSAMIASVDALRSDFERRRFAELAVFRSDGVVPRAAVETLWAHTGGLDCLASHELLVELAERSLIRIDLDQDKTTLAISLHDLLLDLATRMAGDLRQLHQTLVAAYRQGCPDGWASGSDDGYYFQNFPGHLLDSGDRDECERLLLDYRWVSAKLRAVDVFSLIEDYDSHGPQNHTPLGLISDVLRLSAHILATHPEALPAQMLGRLLHAAVPGLGPFLGDAGADCRNPAAGHSLRPLWSSLEKPAGRLIQTLSTHAGGHCAVIGPSGRKVLFALQEGRLQICDLETGRMEGMFPNEHGWVCSVSCAAAANLVVTGSGKGHIDVRADTGELLFSEQLRLGPVMTIAITADGRHVAAAVHEELGILDVPRRRLRRVPRAHSEDISSLCITPDGHAVIFAADSSSDSAIRIRDVESGELRAVLREQKSATCALIVSHDGRFLFAGSRGRDLNIWDLKAGRFHGSLSDTQVSALAITSDGRTLFTGHNLIGKLSVWDVEKGELMDSWRGHERSVEALALTPDERTLISCSSDRTIKAWTTNQRPREQSLAPAAHQISAVAIVSGGDRAVSGGLDELTFWDLRTQNAVCTRKPGRSWISEIVVTADSRMAITTHQWGSIKLWDIVTGDLLRTIDTESRRPRAIAMADSVFVTGGDDKLFTVWSTDSGTPLLELDGPEHEIYYVAVSPDGRIGASASTGNIFSDRNLLHVWDLHSGTLLLRLKGVGPVALTPCGEMVIARDRGGTKVWNIRSGSVQMSVTDFGFDAMALTSDGELIAGASDRTLGVWDLFSGACLAKFHGDAMFTKVAISRNRFIIAGDQLGRLHYLQLCS